MQTIVNSQIPEGLTFDDVLLVPARSEVLPRDVDVTTEFSRNIRLHTPIVSAAMDTVTESELAIAIARAGGIGVIHKNMTIEQQVAQVRRVKRAENGMIYDPITIRPDATVGAALGMMAQHHIGGIPVVDANNYLIGIVTNRDLRFQDNMGLPVSEVMTSENLVTAPQGIGLEEATNIIRNHKFEKLPVVDKDGKLVGLITYKDLMKIKDNPIASKDSKGRLLVAAAVGVKSDTIERIEMLTSAGADAVVVDTAHGHSVYVLDVIKKACKALPGIEIIAGNVATGEAAK
ncbi:MAG: IMP dehydrogenase, partial [Bacteroidetes bacterium]|nr:IMP dehydrogenase [Candidatus Cryptobacteroides faecigallinarum]